MKLRKVLEQIGEKEAPMPFMNRDGSMDAWVTYTFKASDLEREVGPLGLAPRQKIVRRVPSKRIVSNSETGTAEIPHPFYPWEDS
jgi:hypothetical protein